MSLLELSGLPLWAVIATFLLAAGVIGVAGVHMTRLADRLADVTGWGEAVFGAVLLGGSTSLPGIVTSVWTANEGLPQLAVSNAIGGIAAQTVFLVVADISYRRVNLEHAAASVENLLQAALLMTLLAVPLFAASGPEFTVWAIHPASIVLPLGYAFGLRLVAQARSTPLWTPHRTRETRVDGDDGDEGEATAGETVRLWAGFAALALVVGAAGFAVAQSGIAIAERGQLSETLVGMLLTAVATSLPELVTSVAAVRRGALTLAVGGIIGGNSFDVLFVAFADVAYRDGSIYHAIVDEQVFIVALTMIMTGVILLGLLRREKTGFANIGFESILVLVLYVGAVSLLAFGGTGGGAAG